MYQFFFLDTIYLFDVEIQNILHISWKLIDDGKISKNATTVSDDYCPDWGRCEDCFPRHTEMLK